LEGGLVHDFVALEHRSDKAPFSQGGRLTGRTTLSVEVSSAGPLFASFWYCVTPIAVQVLLTTETIARQAKAWHPKFGTTCLEVIDFEKYMETAAAAAAARAKAQA
jgi:hypothetical protein